MTALILSLALLGQIVPAHRAWHVDSHGRQVYGWVDQQGWIRYLHAENPHLAAPQPLPQPTPAPEVTPPKVEPEPEAESEAVANYGINLESLESDQLAGTLETNDPSLVVPDLVGQQVPLPEAPVAAHRALASALILPAVLVGAALLILVAARRRP